MNDEYINWAENPTKENLSKVVDSLSPTITSEITRYNGPPELLRSQAKLLTAKAVKTYDPTQGTTLNTWVVNQLQPLSRYTYNLRTVPVSEVMARQAAELNTKTDELSSKLGRQPTDTELSDFVGISKTKIGKIRKYNVAPVAYGTIENQIVDDTEATFDPGVDFINPIHFAAEAVYDALDARDRMIYDYKTGSHGKRVLTNQEIAKRFGLSAAAISQITADISNRITRAAQHGF